MSISLKTACFVKEFDPKVNTGYPSIHELLGKTPLTKASHIASYLENGVRLLLRGGTTKDVVDPNHPIIDVGGRAVLTDGVWAWPSEAAYYVRKYRMHVHPNFVRHMESSNWKQPESIDVGSVKMPNFIDIDTLPIKSASVTSQQPVDFPDDLSPDQRQFLQNLFANSKTLEDVAIIVESKIDQLPFILNLDNNNPRSQLHLSNLLVNCQEIPKFRQLNGGQTEQIPTEELSKTEQYQCVSLLFGSGRFPFSWDSSSVLVLETIGGGTGTNWAVTKLPWGDVLQSMML